MDLLSPELLRVVREIEVRTRRVVRESLVGNFASAFRGSGIEFASVREYQPGDDVRAIDWNVTARNRRPFIKEFREERQQTVFFLVDASASTRVGGGGVPVRSRSLDVIAALALSAAEAGDRVGGALFTDRVEFSLAPASGRRHALGWIAELAAFEPTGRTTSLESALLYAVHALRRHCVVFLASDFEAGGETPSLAIAARQHDLVALRWVDPVQRPAPLGFRVEFEDIENGGTVEVDLAGVLNSQRLRQQCDQASKAFQSRMQRAGADFLEFADSGNPFERLLEFLQLRVRRRTW